MAYDKAAHEERIRLLLETLRRINSHYGRGDVVSLPRVGMSYPYRLHGVARIKTQHGEEYREFSVSSNNTVSFRGQKRKLGYQPR